MRTIIIAVALVAVAMTASAFKPPSESILTAIRKHSLPDRLYVRSQIDSHCDIPQTDLENEIDGILTRSRIKEDLGGIWLIVDAICLRTNTGYVYHVDPKFRIVADGDLLVIDGTFLNVLGTARDSDRILDAVKDQVEDAVTVFIYAHRDG